MPDDTHRLPDQLRADLRLVFVGTAASTRSAAVGHYYAHPGNRFWRALHEAGITPRRYRPDEFADLLDLGIGFTDLSKTGAGMDHEIARGSFDVAASAPRSRPIVRARLRSPARKRRACFTVRRRARLRSAGNRRSTISPRCLCCPRPQAPPRGIGPCSRGKNSASG